MYLEGSLHWIQGADVLSRTCAKMS